MGLDISHDTWHGAYSAFHRWRIKIAEVAGLGDLTDYEGFTDNGNCKKWDENHPLTPLLNHSDCEGEIEWEKLNSIANSLEELLPLLDEDGGGHIGYFNDKTEVFIRGCRLAYSKKENLEFA